MFTRACKRPRTALNPRSFCLPTRARVCELQCTSWLCSHDYCDLLTIMAVDSFEMVTDFLDLKTRARLAVTAK